MSQLDLSYYLRNVLEMTGCFNSACSAIIREKWMLFGTVANIRDLFL